MDTVRFLDSLGRLLAVARVVDKGTHLGGTVDLSATPPDVRALFDEFEELVNDQIFSLVDEVEAKIDALGVRAVFDGGEAVVADLQVCPAAGKVSFRAAVPFAQVNGRPGVTNGVVTQTPAVVTG